MALLALHRVGEVGTSIHIPGSTLILKRLKLCVGLFRIRNTARGKAEGNEDENGRGLHENAPGN